jgi:uncharacterized surface protein with fasciclin (FAS1) repeats
MPSRKCAIETRTPFLCIYANVTLFTPLDEAFAELSEAELTSLENDSEQATEFLNRYIAPDLIYSFQIPVMMDANGFLEIEMTDGSVAILSLSEESYSDEFYINDTHVNYPNFVAKNGIMHEMKTLLAPANAD